MSNPFIQKPTEPVNRKNMSAASSAVYPPASSPTPKKQHYLNPDANPEPLELDKEGTVVHNSSPLSKKTIYQIKKRYWLMFHKSRKHSSLACSTAANGSMTYQDRGVIKLTALSDNTLKVAGVYRCKCRNLCPLCAEIEGKILGAKIGSWITREVNAGKTGISNTLTMSHTLDDKQEDLEKQLAGGWTHLRKRGYLKGIIWARATETLFNPRTGYHPHYHIIGFGDGIDIKKRFEEINKAWCEYHTKRGFKAEMCAQKSKVIYDAQGAADYMGKPFGAGLELAHSSAKSSKSDSLSFLDLFMSDDPFLQARAFEYFDCVNGSKRFNTSRGELKPDLTIDPELLELSDHKKPLHATYVAISANANIHHFLEVVHDYTIDFSKLGLIGFNAWLNKLAQHHNIDAFVINEGSVSFNYDEEEEEDEDEEEYQPNEP